MIRALDVLVVLTSLALVACSQSTGTAPEVTSTPTNLAEVSYQGIPLPLTNENKQTGAPPPAWLVFNEQAFPARIAAFQTAQAHVDPAEAFPDLPPISISKQTEFIIILASNSLTKFRANVVPWDPQVNPLPLVEAQGQSVTHTTRVENEFTIVTLTAIYSSQQQFLHVYITFSQPAPDDVAGYAHYGELLTVNRQQVSVYGVTTARSPRLGRFLE